MIYVIFLIIPQLFWTFLNYQTQKLRGSGIQHLSQVHRDKMQNSRIERKTKILNSLPKTRAQIPDARQMLRNQICGKRLGRKFRLEWTRTTEKELEPNKHKEQTVLKLLFRLTNIFFLSFFLFSFLFSLFSLFPLILFFFIPLYPKETIRNTSWVVNTSKSTKMIKYFLFVQLFLLFKI